MIILEEPIYSGFKEWLDWVIVLIILMFWLILFFGIAIYLIRFFIFLSKSILKKIRKYINKNQF